MEIPYSLLQLIGGATACIWVGSYSSLTRPPSAKPAKNNVDDDYDPEDDEPDPDNQAGLTMSDAIIFPLMSSAFLYGLYCLITYLDDPNFLNLVMRTYISVVALASLTINLSQWLMLITTMVFPSYWRAGNTIFKVNQKTRSHHVSNATGISKETREFRLGPLPVNWTGTTLSVGSWLWAIRGMVTAKMRMPKALKRITGSRDSQKICPQDFVGAVMAIVIVWVYHNTNAAILANVIAISLCLTTFSVLSTTTFLVGTAVLFGLFFYDIVMVFYTPFMVTVATTLDAPMKITAINLKGQALNMLGLGDIAVPGVFIAMALRFDLWLHYARKIKFNSIMINAMTEDGTRKPTAKRVLQRKPEFVSIAHKWGDWVWTSRLGRLTPEMPVSLTGTQFSKVYFNATMIGYVIGLFLAMGFMVVFRHGQPALLYLVPSVTLALWGTAWWRGEIKYVLRYTEDGSLDSYDTVQEVDQDGKPVGKERDADENDVVPEEHAEFVAEIEQAKY